MHPSLTSLTRFSKSTIRTISLTANDPSISRDDRIMRLLPLVGWIVNMRVDRVRDVSQKEEAREELMSVGILAMIKAVDEWEEEKGASIKTFVEWRVKWGLMTHYRQSDCVSKDERKKIKAGEKEAPVTGHITKVLEEYLEDKTSGGRFEEAEERLVVRKVLGVVDGVDRAVLEMYGRGMQMEEIAEVMGVGKRTVYFRRVAAVKRVRERIGVGVGKEIWFRREE